MKLKFPRWDDEDPSGWVSKAECFFKYHHTPADSKVEIASISLDEDANQWFDWLVACHGEPTWDEFVEGLLLRFGPSAYDNVDGELANIQQTSTVSEYQSRFERLYNRT
jgi:hypothetical protein